MADKHSTNKKGDEDSKPWWPKVPITDDDDRIDVRRSLQRMLIFGNGLRRLLNRMTNSELLGDGAYELIDEVTSFRCMAFHDELVGYTLSDDPYRTVSLKELRDRFGFSEGYNPTRLRDSVVVRMATFGLWKVKIDRENRFAIRLGRVLINRPRPILSNDVRYCTNSGRKANIDLGSLRAIIGHALSI